MTKYMVIGTLAWIIVTGLLLCVSPFLAFN